MTMKNYCVFFLLSSFLAFYGCSGGNPSTPVAQTTVSQTSVIKPSQIGVAAKTAQNPLKGVTIQFSELSGSKLGTVPLDKAIRNAEGAKVSSLKLLIQQPQGVANTQKVASVLDDKIAQQAYRYWSKEIPTTGKLLEVQNFTDKTVLRYVEKSGAIKTISKTLRKNAKLAGVAAALWATYELLPEDTRKDLEKEVANYVE